MHLVEALTEPKRRSLHTWDGTRFSETPWTEVVAGSESAAAALRGLGVAQGTRVACVLTNSPAVVRGLLGVWLAGGVVASLPVPARAMGMDEYAEQLATLCAHVESPVLLVEARLMAFLAEPLAGRVRLEAWESLSADRSVEATPPEGEDLAFIQYSSGSTSMPKGCALSARAIGNQLETIGHMMRVRPHEDVVASWLPLSHDMGMFGCLMFPWAYDLGLILSSPERFMFDPRTWFQDWADFGATMSAGPPSALHVAVSAQRRSRLSGELRMRTCVIGAERIAPEVLAAATDVLSPNGLTASAWLPAYGMAEATLVISSIEADEEPSARRVDSVALADGEVRDRDDHDNGGAATAIVSVGRPRLGVEVRMDDPNRLSEFHVRSTSLADGYFGDPAVTAERFRHGELATGDLGFVRDGELYVVGRGDDVLSVAGRKVYAREIEAQVDMLDAVRSGCSTIVEVDGDGRSRMVMLLELKDEDADCRSLAAEASRAAKAKAGVVLDECIFLANGTLPKTPSGKIQRYRCRHLVVNDELAPLARVTLRASSRRVAARGPR